MKVECRICLWDKEIGYPNRYRVLVKYIEMPSAPTPGLEIWFSRNASMNVGDEVIWSHHQNQYEVHETYAVGGPNDCDIEHYIRELIEAGFSFEQAEDAIPK